MIGEDSALSEGRLGCREHRDLLYRNINPRNAPCKRYDEELRIFFFLMFTDHTTTCFVPSSCDATHKMRRIGCPGDRCRGSLQNGRRCRRSHFFAKRGHGHKRPGHRTAALRSRSCDRAAPSTLCSVLCSCPVKRKPGKTHLLKQHHSANDICPVCR
jgi:hypothetical protein